MIRQRLLLSVIAAFVTLALAACFIGWSTAHTVNHAYDLSVPLVQPGTPVPPNPFTNVSHLSLERNLGVYFFLLGSLLAIVIGTSLITQDRTQGLVPLVLSRTRNKYQYVLGKAVASVAALAAILVVTFGVLSIAIICLPQLSLSLTQFAKLAAFFGLSWVYLSVFCFIGLTGGMLAKSHTMALLLPITVWIIFGFVLPQAITGMEPTALLNPVTIAAPDTTNAFFQHASQLLGSLAFSEHYKHNGLWLLEYKASSPGILPFTSLSLAWTVSAGSLVIFTRRWLPAESELS